MSTTKTPPRWALWVAVIAGVLFILIIGRKLFLYIKAKKIIQKTPELLQQAQQTASATGTTTEQAVDAAARLTAMRTL